MTPLEGKRNEMTDAEFVRHVAHTAEIGDPVDFVDVKRLREIADRIDDRRCPDGGKCHHACDPDVCFRVASCGPLSGVYPRDTWPKAIRLDFGG